MGACDEDACLHLLLSKCLIPGWSRYISQVKVGSRPGIAAISLQVDPIFNSCTIYLLNVRYGCR